MNVLTRCQKLSCPQRNRRSRRRAGSPAIAPRALISWLTLLCGAVPMVRADDGASARWPGWRGPDGTGASPSAGLPERWTDTQGVRWRSAIPGQGTSSPVVWGDRVFVTSADGPQQSNLRLLCLSSRSGQVEWQQQLWGTSPTLHHGSKSDMATPTSVTDGEYVYAFFGTGDVFCFTVDGGMVWQRSLAAEYGPFENRFGHTSSPLLIGNRLIVQCDHYGDSYLLAMDTRTGANRWRISRTGTWHSWSSPQWVRGGDAAAGELIVCGAHRVDAFQPETGEALWTVRGLQRECIPTPVVGHGLIFAVSGPGGATLAIRPGGRGDVTQSHLVWSNRRGAPFVPSPLLMDGCYYLVDDRGIATCLDVTDGKLIWQKRLAGAYTASPVGGDGKAYFTNEDGITTVVPSGRTAFRELSRNPLPEPVYASAAIAGRCLFIRTARHVYCIDGK